MSSTGTSGTASNGQSASIPACPPPPPQSAAADIEPIEDLDVIVIDNGSGMTKAGMSSDREPRVIFPTVVGRPR